MFAHGRLFVRRVATLIHPSLTHRQSLTPCQNAPRVLHRAGRKANEHRLRPPEARRYVPLKFKSGRGVSSPLTPRWGRTPKPHSGHADVGTRPHSRKFNYFFSLQAQLCFADVSTRPLRTNATQVFSITHADQDQSCGRTPQRGTPSPPLNPPTATGNAIRRTPATHPSPPPNPQPHPRALRPSAPNGEGFDSCKTSFAPLRRKWRDANAMPENHTVMER